MKLNSVLGSCRSCVSGPRLKPRDFLTLDSKQVLVDHSTLLVPGWTRPVAFKFFDQSSTVVIT